MNTTIHTQENLIAEIKLKFLNSCKFRLKKTRKGQFVIFQFAM